MAKPSEGAQRPGANGTFGQWKDWLNYQSPGEGDTWITWVEANAKITPPESDTVDLNSKTFGPANGLGGGNTALDWVGAWLLLSGVPKGIGAAINKGLGALGQLAEKGLTGTAAGIKQVPGAQAASGAYSDATSVSGFLSALEQGSTWIRVAEVALGIILLAIGAARISGTQNAVSQIVKARIP